METKTDTVEPTSSPEIIGDQAFVDRLANAKGHPERIDDSEELKQISISVDPHGNIQGDTSHIPDHILKQLQTPQVMENIRAQYRSSRGYDVEPSKAAKYINERSDRRVFIECKPAGVSSKEWRKKKRAEIRKTRKTILKINRSIRHGRQSD